MPKWAPLNTGPVCFLFCLLTSTVTLFFSSPNDPAKTGPRLLKNVITKNCVNDTVYALTSACAGTKVLRLHEFHPVSPEESLLWFATSKLREFKQLTNRSYAVRAPRLPSATYVDKSFGYGYLASKVCPTTYNTSRCQQYPCADSSMLRKDA